MKLTYVGTNGTKSTPQDRLLREGYGPDISFRTILFFLRDVLSLDLYLSLS